MDANTTRHPSRVVSALLRLERAGDEHSRTTGRLCNAAWLVADLLRRQVEALPDQDAECSVRPGIDLDRRGVHVTLSWPNGEPRYETIAPYGQTEPVPTRIAAFALAGAIASGWLDEIITWMASRTAADVAATVTLDAAAQRLPSCEESQPDDCSCESCVRERRRCDICGAPGADIVQIDSASYLGETHPQGAGAYWLLCEEHQPDPQPA